MTKLTKRVMFIDEFKEGGYTHWRIPCDCKDPDHDADLQFEVDEHGFSSLTLSMKIGVYVTPDFLADTKLERFNDWRHRLWLRFKSSMEILFTGYVQMTGEVVLAHNGMDGLRYALDEGQKRVLEAEAAFRAKRKAEKTDVEG